MLSKDGFKMFLGDFGKFHTGRAFNLAWWHVSERAHEPQK